MSISEFISKHADFVTGSLSCFDRIIFKGYLPIHHPQGIEAFLGQRGILLKDFKKFVIQQYTSIKEHAVQMATRLGRPYQYLSGSHRKEEMARKIAEKDGITKGLVCVFSIVEQAHSFRLAYGEGRPRLVSIQPRVLCLYFYFMDEELGLVHVRVQTWFPFAIQIYVNGHEWLARQLDKRHIRYERMDNAFVKLDGAATIQGLANRFPRLKWTRILDRLAKKTNPHLGKMLGSMSYYWCIDQAEYSTDIMFSDPVRFMSLYDRLLRHATITFGADDVMHFLGRKLSGNFKGDVLGRFVRRWPGARIKHSMKRNWIKMYNKEGRVLRIETVINQPREFKIRRKGIRNGNEVTGWFPMAKRVANMERYAEVSLTANKRYIQALSAIDDPTAAFRFLHELGSRKKEKGKSVRALNPLSEVDAQLLNAVFRGEHTLRGFKSNEIMSLLGWRRGQTVEERRRQSARLNRLLGVLRGHKLVSRIPHTRRYKITERGY
jgi:hypothetical protein